MRLDQPLREGVGIEERRAGVRASMTEYHTIQRCRRVPVQSDKLYGAMSVFGLRGERRGKDSTVDLQRSDVRLFAFDDAGDRDGK